MSEDKSKGWINLERAHVLLLDDHEYGLNVLVQIVTAFGVKHFYKCVTIEEAQEAASGREIHIIVANANLRDSRSYEFVHWLRRSKLQPNCFTPVVMICGHTLTSDVRNARDCGANFVMAKPVSPAELLKRILWIAREKRPYVHCGDYVGPDRRFQELGPPEGMAGRRVNDPPEGAAEPEADGKAVA